MANPENEKKIKTRILVWLGTTLGPILLRFCYNTNKWDHHGLENFEEIIKKIKDEGFTGTNLDLVYGLPLQTVSSFKKTVDKAISLNF